jgi:putative transposase
MQKTGKPSRQKVGSEVSGRAREVFKAAGMYPGQDIEVGSGVCQAAAEGRGRAGASDPRASRTARSIRLPRRPRRRRIGQAGEIVNKAEYPNHVWSYDFLEDRTEHGGKLRILVIIDEFTRESLSIKVAPSIPALAVQGILEWLFLVHGAPNFIRSDNGPEFIAKVICQWLKDNGCQTIFIQPGSPWENGYIESFIDKLRDECLNREVFRNGKEAQTIVEAWRQEYNSYRPHSSLGYLTPSEFARRYADNN